jgi:transglutaminase-like putative cysteine protease
MSADQPTQTYRFVAAIVLFAVFGILAAALSGASGTLASQEDITAEAPEIDRTGFICGGSLGDTQRNPIGTGIGEQPNPFQRLNPTVEFIAETPRPTYWRVNAFTAYDDGVWTRVGDAESYGVGIPPVGASTTRLTHQVNLQRGAVTLPAVWQPARVSPEADTTIELSTERGLRVAAPTPYTGNYTLESHCYAPQLEQLRTAPPAYPVSVVQEYTGVPDSVPDSVSQVATNITSDTSDRPYEIAETVATWLATNKEYTLDATHPNGTDPVGHFLTEMDGANSEYFASSAVLMLRSQGVPARYVTGYSPGEALPDTNKYQVRALNAHAWTEVYVPDHGWIRVDPTPEDQRIQTETNAVVTEGVMSTASVTQPCETDPEPTVESLTASISTTQLTVGETAEIAVRAAFVNGSVIDVTDRATVTIADSAVATVENRTVIPQAPGTTTVATGFIDGTTAVSDTTEVTIVDNTTENGEMSPPSDEETIETVSLQFETDTIDVGESIDPTVLATFTDGATADVTTEADIASAGANVADVDGQTVTGVASGTVSIFATVTQGNTTVSDSTELTVLESTGGENDNDSDSSTGDENNNDSNSSTGDENNNDSTDALTVSISPEEPEPGRVATVTVTNGTDPVTNATVLFNDDPVGTTDSNGQIEAIVPFRETLEVTVVRPATQAIDSIAVVPPAQAGLAGVVFAPAAGVSPPASLQQNTSNITENTTITVSVRADVTVSVTPTPVVAGGNHTITARVNNRPLPNASVHIGTVSTTTNEDGNATVHIPRDIENESTIRLQRGALEITQPVTIRTLALTAETTRVLALPGQTVTVTATAGTEPVDGVEIRQGDSVVGTTDADGELNLSMSGALTTSASATYADSEATIEIRNQLIPAIIISVGAVLVLITVTVAVGRRYRLPRIISVPAQRLRRALAQVLFRMTGWIQALGSTPTEEDRSTAPIKQRSLRALRQIIARVTQLSITAIPIVAWRGVKRGVSGLRSVFRRRSSTDEEGPADPQDGSAVTDEETVTLQELWQRFVRTVVGGPTPTQTPGEVADRAKAIGVPAGAVNRLTELFRAAAYGPPEREQDTDDALNLLQRIQSATQTDDEQPQSTEAETDE